MTLILTLNAGSSSIKFALFEVGAGAEPRAFARGQVESIGPAARMKVERTGHPAAARDLGEADHSRALAEIIASVSQLAHGRAIAAVGHRITHGGPDFDAPRLLDAATLEKLAGYIAWAPLHQPYNLACVAGAAEAFPAARQIGCFDTAFHRGRSFASEAYALPRRYYDSGIRRYGFHGLSYEFVAGELARRHPDIAKGRVVIAHLGNGASMCALSGGASRHVTMGFTALDGLAMGTRCGQIDPGVLLYMLREEGLSPDELATLLYRDSGLKGLSGLSADMRALAASGSDAARQAIDYFCYRIRYEIGALAAVLGGLDALVFCGGIGENAPAIRAAACAGLEFLGLTIDERANASGAPLVSSGRTPVLVVPTDEEQVIARAAARNLG